MLDETVAKRRFFCRSMTNSDPAAVTVEFLGGSRSRFCRIDLTTEAAVLVILGRYD